jgi:hypothetical protein
MLRAVMSITPIPRRLLSRLIEFGSVQVVTSVVVETDMPYTGTFPEITLFLLLNA